MIQTLLVDGSHGPVLRCGPKEVFKHEARIAWSSRSFRMELHGTERHVLVADPFIRAIV
jgi:hypothetical protein